MTSSQRLPLDSIQCSPGLTPKHDERLMELMEQANAGKLPVYFASVPIGQIVPFDLDYRPDLHPVGTKAISLCIENWKKGEFQYLRVYQRGAWFVVSDDYIQLFAALQGRPDYLPCWVLGKPEHKQLKDVQGPLAQADVRGILGLA